MDTKPIVYLITATKNRHQQLERVVRFFLDQTYDGKIIHLIYNNAQNPLRLNKNLDSNKFLLINNHLNLTTRKPYSSLGEIYNDIIKMLPEEAEIINFMDDDDIYLPMHVEEGVKGLLKCGLTAYKPKLSIYKQRTRIQYAENNLEPSIFVKASHIRQYGFSNETTAQHLNWIDPLVQKNEIFSDPEGKSTYICDWSQEIRTFKTSGDPHNPMNFKNYSHYSKDEGDGIITPCSESWAKHYYKYAEELR